MLGLVLMACLYPFFVAGIVLFVYAVYKGADRMEEGLEDELAWKRRVIEAGASRGYDMD